jgi:RING finger protein 170
LFTFRTGFLVIATVLYLLSPFDIVPEIVFGLIGIVDDLVVVVMMLLAVMSWYRAAVGEDGRF